MDVSKTIGAMLLLLLLGQCLLYEVRPVEASTSIYIRADGSVDPPTAPIVSADNVTYLFTDDIANSVVVERNNTTIDGCGHVITGNGTGIGFCLFFVYNVSVKNLNVQSFRYGIYLNTTSYVVITRNYVEDEYYGIRVFNSSSCLISDNTVRDTEWGLSLSYSSLCVVSGNNVSESYRGIYLGKSSSSEIFQNCVKADNDGISLYNSFNNTLRKNVMNDNIHAFGVEGIYLSAYINSIDQTNLINGKYVYYLVNRKNMLFDPETCPNAGYLALVNSTNVTVQGFALSDNMQGVLFAFTNGSKIMQNAFSSNQDGIELWGSSNNTIIGNRLTSNSFTGIILFHSSENTIAENNLTSLEYGIYLDSSANNKIVKNRNLAEDYSIGILVLSSSLNDILENNLTAKTTKSLKGIMVQGSVDNNISGNYISGYHVGMDISSGSSYIWVSGNTFTRNDGGIALVRVSHNRIVKNNFMTNMAYGVYVCLASSNIFYLNNFINNTSQVVNYEGQSTNTWDYGLKGNYWSDYNGTDLNHDGIGDTPYKLDYYNIDHRPVMEPVLLVPPTPPPVIGATVEIYPCPMNLKCKNKWITAYVELPSGYEVANINISSLRLNKAVPAEMQYTQIGDYDNDNCPDLMVAFNKSTFLTHLLSGWSFSGSVNITLTVTGSLLNKTLFVGGNTIRISQVAGDVNCDARVDMYDIILASAAYGAKEGQQDWDVNADLAAPLGIINILDLLTVAANYGNTG